MPGITKRGAAFLIFLEATVVLFAIPLSMSAFSLHYGWNKVPGMANLLGIIVVVIGFGLLAPTLREQFKRFNKQMKVDAATPEYLIQTGPYCFTRNPLVIAGGLIWLGWAVFFGSLLILAGFAALVGVNALIVVPWEERKLEEKFGDSYLRYEKAVARWLGRRHRLQ